VKLPTLPEFEYDYAYIAENVAIKGWYALFVSDKAFVYDKLTNTMIRQDGSTVMRCVCTGEAWGEFVAHDADSLLAPIWANYDVLDTNGDVRLYATEPAKMWENARSFLIGLAMAFAGKPLPISQGEKEPVAYLYNGVRLPKLPEWDRETYPYAAIAWQNTANPQYYLSCFSVEPIYKSAETTTLKFVSDSCVRIQANMSLDNTFGEAKTIKQIFNYDIDRVVWTNFDLRNTATQEVWFYASDPIPVYE
jgi:hypothetical protein